MSDKNPDVIQDYSSNEKKIEKALKEIDRIHKEKSLVKTGEEMELLERRIIKATDRLSGALGAQKIQDSVKNSELKKEGLRLAKSYPMADEEPRIT